MPFDGLRAEHFAAYTPDKWSSNVHNLTRMRAKDTLFALCGAATQSLAAALKGLSRAASDDVPNIVNHKKVDAQWVYWFRDEQARKHLASFLEKTPLDGVKLFDIAPQDKHLTLAVVLSAPEVWVGLRVAPGAVVDRRNLAALLGKSHKIETFLALLAALPRGAGLGLGADAVPAAALTAEMALAQSQLLDDAHPAWRLGQGWPVADALALGPALATEIAAAIAALAPIYRFVAWAPDNDQIGANREILAQKAEQQREVLGLHAGDRVRIIAGVFSGKTGVVQEIDARAHVKVRVGTLSVVVPGSDIAAAR
ncbi:MAG: hypothetical protein HYZ27_06625 [Deltaproteobacteria bacterium]|nr:hypothetical protein [Deltaproteobacteria bacterium]